MSNRVNDSQKADKVAFGQYGIRTFTETTSPTGEVYGVIISATEDAAYTADSLADKGDSSISVSFGKGWVSYGRFTNIDVSAGTVQAYII